MAILKQERKYRNPSGTAQRQLELRCDTAAELAAFTGMAEGDVAHVVASGNSYRYAGGAWTTMTKLEIHTPLISSDSEFTF